MEASAKVAPYKALAIAVTKRTLYEEKPPLVGVGLVYKLHYISTVQFSAAYMHLNVWHSAASNKESENRLDEPCLLFVNISKMSDVILVAVQHPILLDLTSKEAMGGTGEPVSPLSFRGFRLHTTWTQPPGGELTHHISLPHFLGESYSSLIDYESERFPQGLMQGPKIAIDLKPPAKDHWNIASHLILPWMLEYSRQRCTAKQVAQSQEMRLKGAMAPQTEAPTPEKPCELEAGGSGKVLPTKMAPDREQVLETTCKILERIHAFHLQTMHEMGSMREVDRNLAQTLMAEFVRLQLIVGEDLTRSLMALRANLEAFCVALVSDIARTMDLHPDDPVSHQVKAALRKFQQTTSLKVTLPLMELEAAHEDMEEFMQSCLQELSSQTESRELIEELSQKLADHMSGV